MADTFVVGTDWQQSVAKLLMTVGARLDGSNVESFCSRCILLLDCARNGGHDPHGIFGDRTPFSELSLVRIVAVGVGIHGNR